MKPLFHRKHKTQQQENTDNASQKTSQNITVRRYKSPFYDCNKFIHEDIGSMAGVAIDEMNNLLEIGKVELGGDKVRPLIYAVNKNQWGEIAMDEEEFKKILNEVYDAGYEDGRIQATRAPLAPTPIPVPSVPTPIPHPYKPYWDMATNASHRTSTTTTTDSSPSQGADSTDTDDNK